MPVLGVEYSMKDDTGAHGLEVFDSIDDEESKLPGLGFPTNFLSSFSVPFRKIIYKGALGFKQF